MSAARFLAFALMMYGVLAMNWSNLKSLVRPKDEHDGADDHDGTGTGARESGRHSARLEELASPLSPGAHLASRRV